MHTFNGSGSDDGLNFISDFDQNSCLASFQISNKILVSISFQISKRLIEVYL